MPDPHHPPRGGRDEPAAEDATVVDVHSDIQLVDETVNHLVDCCLRGGFPGPRLFNFQVGLAEALTNAMLYGNAGDPRKHVRLTLTLEASRVVVHVEDEGNGFDPDSLPDPTLPENLHRPGGRGVFLIRKLMDEVDYDRGGSLVRLVLYRHLPPRRSAGA
jgi:serine/threonine-protein kinase RsbW